MKKIIDFKVVENKRLNKEYVRLTLQSPEQLPEITPGQFVQVKVEGSPETYLRRPISIHDVDYNQNLIYLLVQEVGKGTIQLGKLVAGDNLNLIVPLGNSFTVLEKGKALLVGGGCGIAPLLYLGRKLKANGITPHFLLGARSAEGLIEQESYQSVGELYNTTEDGTAGVKGYVIHHPVMKAETPEYDIVYTCGPEPMMKVVAKWANQKNIKCEVSLENSMACGIGTCLCCVTKTKDGHKCTCTDGPIFDSNYLEW